MRTAIILTEAWLAIVSAAVAADRPSMQFIEFQSEPLTPALRLEESPRPVHQVRILVDHTAKRATLILDPNLPEFDEFGNLVGGILTPQTTGKGGESPTVKRKCAIEFIKSGPNGWNLFRVTGAEVRSPLFLATRGSILDGGPARLLVLGADHKVKSVVAMTRYGLVVP